MGHPFQQFRDRPGGHAVQIGAALLDHRGDHGQRVHLFERPKQPFGDIRVGLVHSRGHSTLSDGQSFSLRPRILGIKPGAADPDYALR